MQALNSLNCSFCKAPGHKGLLPEVTYMTLMYNQAFSLLQKSGGIKTTTAAIICLSLSFCKMELMAIAFILSELIGELNMRKDRREFAELYGMKACNGTIKHRS